MIEWWIIVLIFVVIALVSNIILWRNNLYGKSPESSFSRNRLIPNGITIGLIWTIIFGFLGYSLYLLLKHTKEENNFLYGKEGSGFSVASISIIAVSLFCLMYPVLIYIFARGDPVKSEKYAKVINLIALVLAFVLGLLVIREDEKSFLFILPLIVWASYVNFASSLYDNFGNISPTLVKV
jgi:tryptophan-rich sensory protein